MSNNHNIDASLLCLSNEVGSSENNVPLLAETVRKLFRVIFWDEPLSLYKRYWPPLRKINNNLSICD